MEHDPTRMCEVMVGLGGVDVVGVGECLDGVLEVEVRTRGVVRPLCPGCGGGVWSKGERRVGLVDLPAFGRPVRVGWRKHRWVCPDDGCGAGSFTEQDPRIAPERALLTSRAARWATRQVGGSGRTVTEVAEELGCDWHTVNNEVTRWGKALLDADHGRVGKVEALGLDETLFYRFGRRAAKVWCTSVAACRPRQADRRCPRQKHPLSSFVASSAARRMAGRNRLGGDGPVGPLSGRLRPDAAPRQRQTARPVPRR